MCHVCCACSWLSSVSLYGIYGALLVQCGPGHGHRIFARIPRTDTDFLVRILADTSDTRDFLKLFLWQDERHADILAKILARMSARMSVSDGVGVGVVECELIGLRP